MTDDQPDDPQSEVQRLTAELARREREIEELKRESSRTRNVGDALWSHEIYLRARKKLAAGVTVVLVALSALGLVTVAQLYQRGVDYVDGELRASIGDRIKQKADDMVEDARKNMDRQISEHIRLLIEEKKAEMEAQITAMQQDVEAKLATSASQAIGRMTALVEEKKAEIEAQIEVAEQEIKVKISELEKIVQDEGDALSKRVKQIRIAMTASAEVERAEDPLPETAVDCDPNYLDADQIALVAVRQLSKGTGKFLRNGREVFKNTLFLDVRGAANTANATAQASCILDGVDRVVYGADPKWYKPSEFVRIDRENEYRFTISGWGPTELAAQVYFIGHRDPMVFEGNLAINTVTGADKQYLGDAPIDFQ